jgi:hypothetical protein
MSHVFSQRNASRGCIYPDRRQVELEGAHYQGWHVAEVAARFSTWPPIPKAAASTWAMVMEAVIQRRELPNGKQHG